MIRLQVKRMGGPFSIAVVKPRRFTENQVEHLIQIVFSEVQRIEDLLTDFKESPLTELNRHAAHRPWIVPEELFRLIDYALGVSRDCDGAFDITYASVGHLWRKAFREGILPNPTEMEQARRCVDYRGVTLNSERFEISYDRSGMTIGLGGVGKGYAVDAAARMLLDMGLENFLVNGAGDIRVSSARDAMRPWRVGIKNPFVPKDAGAGMVTLSRGAVATSGDYERFMVVNGKRYHHVIDARTATCRNDIRSTTLLAPSALQADVYATTVMALGLEEGLNFLSRHGSIRSVVIAADGGVHRTGFEEAYVRSTA